MNYTKLTTMTATQYINYRMEEIPSRNVSTMTNWQIDYFYNNTKHAINNYKDSLEGDLQFFTYKQICAIAKTLNLQTKRSRKAKESAIVEYFMEACKSAVYMWRYNHTRLLEAIRGCNPFEQKLNEIARWEEETGKNYFD